MANDVWDVKMIIVGYKLLQQIIKIILMIRSQKIFIELLKGSLFQIA